MKKTSILYALAALIYILSFIAFVFGFYLLYGRDYKGAAYLIYGGVLFAITHITLEKTTEYERKTIRKKSK
ncbi:MAG: hypothetical protein QMC78_03935 [Methanocellales archaeon]|nr:hypothetical protein [Methanocellales archaeon]